MDEIKYSQNIASEDMIYAYLASVADLFVPNLLKRVNNLREYAKKIKQKAIVFEAWHKDCLIGTIAAYFNDFDSKIGFITSACVAEEYQNKGIAKNLLLEVVKYGRENNFIKIRLEVCTQNNRAIAFYNRMNFVAIDKNQQTDSFVMELCI